MATQLKTKFVKLIMVTGDNNNKYYEMLHEGGTQFTVKYGRVESTAVTGSYDMEDWDKKYREKIKKGYKDVTDYVSTKVVDTPSSPSSLAKIAETKVEEFMSLMKAYTDGLVSKTYSVKATSVTQAQVDAAQGIIDKLTKLEEAKKPDTRTINEALLELYTTIPRRMTKTTDHLYPNLDKGYLQREQDQLDAMASQVLQLAPKKSRKGAEKAQTLLDVLGISMKTGSPSPRIQYLLDQLRGHKVEALFEVTKSLEDDVFSKWLAKQSNKTTRVLIHGTQCSSCIPILEIGLKIRPAGNFQFSGKAFGPGNYYSEVCSKSLGYTGYQADQVLLIYEVHTGNPFVYNGRYLGNAFPLNYKELSSRGFDSTFVPQGNGMLNSELICYREEQCRIIGIIWLKR